MWVQPTLWHKYMKEAQQEAVRGGAGGLGADLGMHGKSCVRESWEREGGRKV